MALAVGSKIVSNRDFSTGNAPGESRYNLSAGAQANIKGYRTVGGKTYVDLDFTPYGGGTGWALYDDSLFRAQGSPAPAAPAPAASSGYQAIIDNSNKQYDAMLQKQAAERQAQEAADAAKEQAYLTKFTNAINGQETLSAMNDRLSGELGLPGIRQSVQTLSNTVNQLPDAERAQARGLLASNAQIQGAITNKLGQLAPQLTQAAQQQGAMEQLLSQRLQLGVQDQDRALQPLKLEGEMLNDAIARHISNFNIDKQRELDTILNKISQGQQLAMAEIERANQLADEERAYSRQKELLQFQADLDRKNQAAAAALIPRTTTLQSSAPSFTKPAAQPSLDSFNKQSAPVKAPISNYFPGTTGKQESQLKGTPLFGLFNY